MSEIFKAKYQGIRPAAGYPSLPDQSLNFLLNDVLDFEQIGVSMTENGAMSPVSTISGFYLAHPEANYFLIGKIDEEQFSAYCQKRGMDAGTMRKFVSVVK